MVAPTSLRGFSGDRARECLIALATLVFALTIRLPAIAVPVADWDESSFLAVGQRTAAGELPFTTTLENKPPLAAVPHALFALFGLSDLSLARAVATAIVAGIAFLTVRAGFRNRSTWWRLPITFAVVWLMSLAPLGLPWMTTLNVLLAFAVAAALLYRPRECRPWLLAVIGIVLGSLPFLRTNWLPVAVVLLAATLITTVAWRRRALLGAAFLAPGLIVGLAYALSGNWHRLTLGMIGVPRSNQAVGSGSLALPTGMLLVAFVSVVLLATSVVLDVRAFETKLAVLDGAMATACVLLVAAAAWQEPDYPHHVIQIIPFLALGAARLWTHVPGRVGVLTGATAGLILLMLISVPASWTAEGAPWVRYGHWRDDARVSQAEGDLASAIKRDPCSQDGTVLALRGNQLLYQAHLVPAVPEAVHPSMLLYPGAIIAIHGQDIGDREVIRLAVAKKPDFIITAAPFMSSGAEALLNRTVARYYQRTAYGKASGLVVFRRRGCST